MPAQHLNPRVRVEGAAVVMSTVELAGVPVRALGAKVTSLKSRRDETIAAPELLFTGI